MKFAQELEESAVPEWRNMYMDYKGGKKKWKALSRVVKDIGSATTPDQAVESPFVCLRHAPVRSLLARRRRHARGQLAEEPATSSHEYQDQVPPLHEDPTPQADVAPINERSPLKQEACRPRIGRYGSIQGSQSGDEDDAVLSRAPSAPSLQLPRPAIDAPTYDDHEHGRPLGSESTTITSGDAVSPLAAGVAPQECPDETTQLADTQLTVRIANFFQFLDTELHKVDTSYSEQENAAQKRLDILRHQLHITREHRLEEVHAADPARRPSSRREGGTNGQRAAYK
jgi:xenotropic and polytropic retrovirus receptor 1